MNKDLNNIIGLKGKKFVYSLERVKVMIIFVIILSSSSVLLIAAQSIRHEDKSYHEPTYMDRNMTNKVLPSFYTYQYSYEFDILPIIGDRPNKDEILSRLYNIQMMIDINNYNYDELQNVIDCIRSRPYLVDFGIPTIIMRFYPMYMGYLIGEYENPSKYVDPVELYIDFNWEYLPDPMSIYGIDLIQYDNFTNDHHTGDCEDLAISLANIMIKNGVQTKIAMTDDHMFVLVERENEWLILDPTLSYEDKMMGVEIIQGFRYVIPHGNQTSFNTGHSAWNDHILSMYGNIDRMIIWSILISTIDTYDEKVSYSISNLFIATLVLTIISVLFYHIHLIINQNLHSFIYDEHKDVSWNDKSTISTIIELYKKPFITIITFVDDLFYGMQGR